MERAKDRVGTWGTESPPKGGAQEKIGEGKQRKPCSDPDLCEKEHDRGWSPPVQQASGHQEPSEVARETKSSALVCAREHRASVQQKTISPVMSSARAEPGTEVNVDSRRGAVANKISASQKLLLPGRT